MMMELDETELPIYIQTIRHYHRHQEEALQLIFSLLSPLLQQADFDRSNLYQDKIILELKVCLYSDLLSQQAQRYIIKYKEELLSVYTMLKECLDDGKNLMPTLLDQLLSSQTGKCFVVEEEVAYLYIICSVFMPVVINMMEDHVQDAESLQLRNPEWLCYSFDFNHIYNLYQSQQLFLREVLEKPLRIIKNIPTLKGYDFYQKVDLSCLANASCLVTSTIINPQYTSLIPLFNCAKIINFSRLSSKRPRNNNSFLNLIETLDIRNAFSFTYEYQRYLPSKSFCLTFAFPQDHLLKMRTFFDMIPPEIAPLTKYDILSYASNSEFRTIFYRTATEGYFQHCPQSQFMQVYYLCNESYVEWISIPQQCSGKGSNLNEWSEFEFQSMHQGSSKAVRGIQKKGEFVVIGQGHEHFWKVRKGNGAAVLIKWSVLLKTDSQIINFLRIVQHKQQHQITNIEKLTIPLRRILLSYISHQYMNIDLVQLKKLINFVSNKIEKEKAQFQKLISLFPNNVSLNKCCLPSRLRMCKSCGQEILNLSILSQDGSLCVWCLVNELPADLNGPFMFIGNYMCRPSLLDQYLRDIYSSRQQSVQHTPSISLHESVFCEGQFTGSFQARSCSGTKILDEGIFENRLWDQYPSISLQMLMRRGYFSTVESAMKTYPLSRRRDQAQTIQMELLLIFFARNCLQKDEKARIREQIELFQRDSNFVEWTMELLGEEEGLE